MPKCEELGKILSQGRNKDLKNSEELLKKL